MCTTIQMGCGEARELKQSYMIPASVTSCLGTQLSVLATSYLIKPPSWWISAATGSNAR